MRRPGLSREERRACAAVIRAHSRTFHGAGRLLPRAAREAAFALYAFCRRADEAVDAPGAADPAARVKRLSERLAALYAPDARPEDAVEAAFLKVVRTTGLPRGVPEALLEGMAFDAAGGRVADQEALARYAFCVASSVGVMMAYALGATDEAALRRACALGLAMQLTNIARDLPDDLAMGRCYLPPEWLPGEGAPLDAPARRRAVAVLLALAAKHYREAEPGIARLPGACRPAIWLARHRYEAIGRTLRASGGDPFAGRAVVPRARRLAALAAALRDACLPASWFERPRRAPDGVPEGPCAEPPFAAWLARAGAGGLRPGAVTLAPGRRQAPEPAP